MAAVFAALNAFDAWLAGLLPLAWRIGAIGVLAGFAAIGLYALTSNQPAIAAAKRESHRARRRMANADLPELGRLTRQSLKLSLGLLGRMAGPALLSAVPVLVLAVWLDFHHGFAAPDDGAPLRVSAASSQVPLEVDTTQGGLRVTAEGRTVYAGDPLSPPVTTVARRRWWNDVLPNPAGYLSPGAPVELIRFDLRRKRVLPHLPPWAAGWEGIFFAGVLAGAAALKLAFRIE